MRLQDMDEEERYIDEFGAPIPRYKPLDPDKRGRHVSFSAAAKVAFEDLTTVRNEFFDSIAERWTSLFPKLPARPGRYDDGKIFLYVKNAPTNFAVRPKLPRIKKALAALPGAPKRIDLRLEIHP